jgi:hypothetical protein
MNQLDAAGSIVTDSVAVRCDTGFHLSHGTGCGTYENCSLHRRAAKAGTCRNQRSWTRQLPATSSEPSAKRDHVLNSLSNGLAGLALLSSAVAIAIKYAMRNQLVGQLPEPAMKCCKEFAKSKVSASDAKEI